MLSVAAPGLGPSRSDRPPLRVVHLIWRLSRGGGVQTVVRQLAEGVDPAVVDLHVVSARPSVDMDVVDELPTAFHSLDVPWDFSARDRVVASLRAGRLVARLRPDVVHVHSGTGWMGYVASVALWRVPFVLEVHDAPGSGRHSSATERIEGWWARLRRVTVLVHSTSVEGEVASRWTVAGHRLCRVPLAVDVDRFPEPGGTVAPVTAPFEVIAVGRMVALKRFELAIEAVAGLVGSGVDARLTLVGSGPAVDDLASRASALGIADRVRFAGYVEDDELGELLAASDVLVSTSEYEGFGLTLLEAMAASTPTIAMAVGGVTDVVEDGVSGYLVASGDVGQLEQRLGEMCADRELTARLGRQARQRVVERFSAKVFSAAISDLYAELARPAARTSSITRD